MLQIVTGMYFRPGQPVRSNLIRQVVYTNCAFLNTAAVELPVGRLLPSDGHGPVAPVTVEVVERLQMGESAVVSTGGDRLVDDLADVLSFGLNATFHRSGDMVRRLVPARVGEPPRGGAASLFRQTFDAAWYPPPERVEGLRVMMRRLLALERRHYEAAMRAIRRIVRATQRAADDPTLAYVDLVAALESLSGRFEAAPVGWQNLDQRKRGLVDEALDGVDPEAALRVRAAVLEGERAGARHRFVDFVLNGLPPTYFRDGAVDAVRPIRRPDLERALRTAYQVRSGSVHSLEELPDEAWVLGDRSDTVTPRGLGLMLGLEGLARLARDVVGSYIEQAPTGVDPDFDWRESIPGLIRGLEWAPEYWLGGAARFTDAEAGRYFSGLVGHILDSRAHSPERGIAVMDAVMDRVEHRASGTNPQAQELMVALYLLYHRVTHPSLHRPDPIGFLSRHATTLERRSLPLFAVSALTWGLRGWTREELIELASTRREERCRRKHLHLPPGLDAYLQALAAEALLKESREAEAREVAAGAVEEAPGSRQLMAWERALAHGHDYALDVAALLQGREPEPVDRSARPASGARLPQPPTGVGADVRNALTGSHRPAPRRGYAARAPRPSVGRLTPGCRRSRRT